MSEKTKFTITSQGDTQFVMLPVEITPKGVKYIVLDLDDFEMAETGTKQKETPKGKLPVSYMKFRIK